MSLHSFLHTVEQYSYLISVTLGFVALYLFFRFKIASIEKQRQKSLERREITEAVETYAAPYNQEEHIKEKGHENIEDRFGFIKRAMPITLIFLWGLFLTVPQLGKVPAVYISIIAAVASVIVGFAFRPFLENLFSGVVISFARSVRIGDTVMIDGEYGVIEQIGLTYAVLRKWDWNRVVIPNAKLINKEVMNYTMTDSLIWAHVEFHVSPSADIELVEKLAIETAEESSYFNNSETPSFWIMELGKDSMCCWVAAWANNPSDAWELKSEIRKELSKKLIKNNIASHQHLWISKIESKNDAKTQGH